MIRTIPFFLLSLLAAPLAAQEAPPSPPPATVTAEQAIETAKDVYGPTTGRQSRTRCPKPAEGGEIVVCAELEEQSQFRVEGTPSDGTRGDPRAPNLESGFGHTGMGVTFKGCFIPPCPPPMAKIIDLKAIPEAPPSSDADRAARGLAPARGGEISEEAAAAAARDRDARAGAATTPPRSASPEGAP